MWIKYGVWSILWDPVGRQWVTEVDINTGHSYNRLPGARSWPLRIESSIPFIELLDLTHTVQLRACFFFFQSLTAGLTERLPDTWVLQPISKSLLGLKRMQRWWLRILRSNHFYDKYKFDNVSDALCKVFLAPL